MENSRKSDASGMDSSSLLRNWASFWEEGNKPSPLDMEGAICDGNLMEVKRLLDAGVSPNSTSSSGDSMLYTALLFGHSDIASLLRERGALYGLTEAALAGDSHWLALLLDAGEDVNYMSESGSCALHLACHKGHTEAVRLLLTRGANPHKKDNNRRIPFETACINDFPEIAHLLADAGTTVGIVEAAYLNDLPLVKRLLGDGEDIETKNVSGATPLIAASACGHIDTVRFLLERGTNCNAETGNGLSALRWAVSRENVPLIHLLIDNGANPNSVSQRGWTALINAATFGKLHSVEALLARGADPNLIGQDKTNRVRNTALFSCIRAASAFGHSKKKIMTNIAAVLIKAGADIEARTEIGHTPLMQAASAGLVEIVRLLLSYGANVNASAQEGFATPLSCARRNGVSQHRGSQAETCTLIMEALGPEYAIYDAAECGDLHRLNALLDAGAPADKGLLFNNRMADSKYFSRESQEQTPLMAAAEKGHVEIVRFLLTRAELCLSSKDKALWIAEYQGHEETSRLLRESGAVNPRRQPA